MRLGDLPVVCAQRVTDECVMAALPSRHSEGPILGVGGTNISNAQSWECGWQRPTSRP